MHRLIKILFATSDFFAWIALAFATLGAVTYPISGPARAAMQQQTLSTWSIAGTCALWAAIAVGAFLVTRRKATGVILISASILIAAGATHLAAGITLAGAAALLFGLPFLLVLLQAKNSRPASAP